MEQGLISKTKDKNGRSFNIRTTKKFQEYFKLKGDIKALVKKLDATEDLKNRVAMLQEELVKVKTENAGLKNKLSGISQNADAGMNNLELLKRISALEKALSKAGINPTTIE